jgi:acetyl-CoA C-acetyltransferase/acetyl-CoA acyltransferase
MKDAGTVFTARTGISRAYQGLVDRQCACGLMDISTAAKPILGDGMQVLAAGGCDNIMAVQTPYMEWASRERDPVVIAHAAHVPGHAWPVYGCRRNRNSPTCL